MPVSAARDCRATTKMRKRPKKKTKNHDAVICCLNSGNKLHGHCGAQLVEPVTVPLHQLACSILHFCSMHGQTQTPHSVMAAHLYIWLSREILRPQCASCIILLDGRADVHVRNLRGETPLHYTAICDIVQLVIVAF